jgi:hypothetical protein
MTSSTSSPIAKQKRGHGQEAALIKRWLEDALAVLSFIGDRIW